MSKASEASRANIRKDNRFMIPPLKEPILLRLKSLGLWSRREPSQAEPGRHLCIPQGVRHLRSRQQSEHLIDRLAGTGATCITQHIHWLIAHVEQQHQPMLPADAVDLLAFNTVHTLVDGTVRLQIMAELYQVKQRVINTPRVRAPLGNVMDEILAQYDLLIPHHDNIQATTGDGLHMHAACAKVVVTVDAVTHPVRTHFRLTIVKDISAPGEGYGQCKRPRRSGGSTQQVDCSQERQQHRTCDDLPRQPERAPSVRCAMRRTYG